MAPTSPVFSVLFVLFFLAITVTYRVFNSKHHGVVSSVTLYHPPQLVLKKKYEVKKQALVGIYGVLARSFIETNGSIHRHIIVPLVESGYDVDVYIFDVVVDGFVDGVSVNRNTTMSSVRQFHPSVVYEQMDSVRVDDHVKKMCGTVSACSFRYDAEENNPTLTANAFRQLYSENQVALHASRHKKRYDVVVATCADNYFVQNISLVDVERAQSKSVLVLLTQLNEGEGYTNGFVIGGLKAFTAVMSRFDHYARYAHLKRDYERVLLEAVIQNNLLRQVTEMPFCKIRANKVVWAGPGFPPLLRPMCDQRW